MGAALLVSPAETVVLASGATADIDVHHIARDAGTRGGAARVVSFAAGSICVYAGPIAMGWMLCVLSAHGAQPADVVDRLRRASAVLALALADGVASSSGEGGSGPAGAPAEVRQRTSKPRRRSAN